MMPSRKFGGGKENDRADLGTEGSQVDKSLFGE